MKKRKLILIMIVVVVMTLSFTLYPLFKTFIVNDDEIWGNEPDEPYITITGKKPTDAQVVAWAAYWVTGDECKTYSYDMFGRKAHQGGKINKKYTYDFSDDPSRYELRLPYKSVVDSNNCTIVLRDFQVNAFNDFAFIASLKSHPQGDLYYEKAIPTSTLIEARGCDAKIYKALNNLWYGDIRCEYFRGEKSRAQDVRPYDFYYDFSQFSDDTIIKFNILAGENYRSEPLDKEKGPQ